MYAPTELELIARHRIQERTALGPHLPRPRRRSTFAATLRRVADQLDG
jgi:hypothetical protein